MAGGKACAEGPADATEPLDPSAGRRMAAVTGQTLCEHFPLPLHTVALKFGMCTTAFKKMCRRLGIAKWPHRQVLPPPAVGPCKALRSVVLLCTPALHAAL